MATPLLTRRAVLLASVESTYNTAAATSAGTDAVLVADPAWSADISKLERNFARNSLSKLPDAVGRKLAKMSFTTEVRGNGSQNSGSIADAPMMSRLLRGCGYALTAFSAPAIGSVLKLGTHATSIAWVASGTLTNTSPIPYKIEVTTAGASGVAAITVTSPVTGESNTSATVTSGTAFTIGGSGMVLTPTWTGSLVAGQTWSVLLKPKGIEADPVSSGFESLTMRMYLDGVLHVITGARGTFSVSTTSGQLGSINWDFTGQYVAPTDTNMPTSPTYETTLPAMFENAQVSVDGFGAVIDSLSFTQNNDVQVRSDANSPDGYNGVTIVGRAPEAGIDPEATLVADHDFWGKLSTAKQMPFTARFGAAIGNTVYLTMPSTQYTGLTYADRSGTRTYDAGLAISGVVADDEVSLFFA